MINGLSDVCFVNLTTEKIYVELSKKVNDTVYKNLPYSLSINQSGKECLLELSSSIYHYKIYKRTEGDQSKNILSLEGEFRLKPNEKMEQEVK